MTGSENSAKEWSDVFKWPWVQDNILWVIGIFPLVLVAYRVFFVSLGDPVTLRLLVSNLDVTQILMVTALTLLPIILFYSSLVVMERVVRDVPGENLPGWTFQPALFALVVAAFTMKFVTLVGASIGIGLFFVGVVIFNFWRVRKKGLQRTVIFGGFLVTLSVIQAFVASSAHWIPAENVHFRSGDIRSGYELSSDDDSVIMQWTAGGSERVYSDTINRRELCITSAEKDTLLFRVAPSVQRNPECVKRSVPKTDE